MTHITFANSATLPRVPHRWIAGDGPCHDCGAAVGEIHRVVGCHIELCPQCREIWIYCGCRTVDVIPNHGRNARRRCLGEIHEFEDGNGRAYEMRTEGDEE